MDVEQKQLQAIDHLVKRASVLKGSTLVPLIFEATLNPSLFAFSEILCVPNVVEVQFSVGRDLRPGRLGNVIETLSGWLSTSDSMLLSIQDEINWAGSMGVLYKKHQKDVANQVEEVKKSLSLKKLQTVSRSTTSGGTRRFLNLK